MVLAKKLANMFPIKLHYILSQNTGAIGWTPDGTAIRILDKDLLVKDYLPTYFNQKSFASFRHQLNAYGFSKVSKGENVNCYFHPCFTRDQPGQIFQMFRHAPRFRRVRKDGKLILVPLESIDGETVASVDLNEAPDDGTVPEILVGDQSVAAHSSTTANSSNSLTQY